MKTQVSYFKMVRIAYLVFGGVCLAGGFILLLAFRTDLPLMLRFISKVGVVFGAVGIAGTYVSGKVLGNKRTSNHLINMVLLLATITFMTGLGEVVVRFALKDITTTQYSASYFSTRWASSHVRLNSLGFREKEIPLQKSKGIYRIVVIGDSFTFGQGIVEGKRFSNIMQKNLQESNRSYEVLNFGWVGVDTVRETRFLDMILDKYDPDFILLQWFVNDVLDDEHLKKLPKRWKLVPSWTLHRHLNYHSGLYYLLNEQLHALQMKLGLSEQYDDYYRRSWKNSESKESMKYKEALRVFIQKCNAAQTPVGFVLFPKLLPDLDKNYPYQYVHDLVLEVCRKEEVNCLDLRESLAEFFRGKDSRSLHVNRFDTHPSELVNHIAAKQIYEEFSSYWMKGVMQNRGK